MSHDTLIHRLVRPAVRALARTSVTPNQVTAARLSTALAAAAAFAVGDPRWTAAGAGVFLLSLLLDRADGELARQTGKISRSGHRFDLVADCASNAAALIGLGVGQADPLGWSGPGLGLLAGFGVGAMFWILNVVRETPAPSLTLADGQVVIDPDDAMALLPLLLWLGLATPVLIAAAVITPLAAVWMALSTRRGREAPR